MNIKRVLTQSTVLLAASLFTVAALATGPRIKQDLFTPNANAIYALDFPPFITTELGGGVAVDLVNAVLQAEKISASINTLPSAKMMKYYVFQEKALALVGSHLRFTAEQQKPLIFVPLLRLNEHYYVYLPRHPEGLPWQGDLKALAKLSYGANPEEDVTAYQQAGLQVETGNTLSLLEKLQAGQVDFIGNSELAVNWYLDRTFAADKDKFSQLKPEAGAETIFIIFNKNHPQGEALAKQFKKGLSAIIANGQYKALLEKQLGEAVERNILPLQ